MHTQVPPKPCEITWLPRMLSAVLIRCGNLIYGREPSYLKFRAVEVIARVPYHSWSAAAFTLLTLWYADSVRALALSKLAAFAHTASQNETMHVIVISELTRQEEGSPHLHYTLIPILFAFVYFWASYLLYLIRPRLSFELNYLFESHAEAQYARFLALRGTELAGKPMHSEFLAWYGRSVVTQYDFFQSVLADERAHRTHALECIDYVQDAARMRMLFCLGAGLVAAACAYLTYLYIVHLG